MAGDSNFIRLGGRMLTAIYFSEPWLKRIAHAISAGNLHHVENN
jgi:hypothetical protein